MDTLLYDGDFKVDGRGRPIPCTGYQELLQRALIRLTVRRGSFDYDPELGSRLDTLGQATHNLEARALELIREALLPLTGLTPTGVIAEPYHGGENLRLTVLLQAGEQHTQLEVTV